MKYPLKFKLFVLFLLWIHSGPVCFVSGASVPDRPSIHILQLMEHRGEPAGMHREVVTYRRTRIPTKTVYGWYPYWMGSAYTGLEWDLLTHISFFSLEATPSGTISDSHGWPGSWQGFIDTAHGAGVEVTITCTLFGSGDINTLIEDSGHRATLIGNLVQASLDGDADGINIDFEGSSLNKPMLVQFMNELRSALDAHCPGAHLSMATPAVDWNGCFDFDQLAVPCDILIPMCYDYHWKGGDPGPVSPLESGSTWSQYCVTWTVDDYLNPSYGILPEQLAVGVPYYGLNWEVTGDPSLVPASDAPGNASAVTYSYVRTYHASYPKHWDNDSETPWYYYYSGSEPRQVWYDDHTSLGLKYDLVLDRDLAGIGIWALGYDGSYPELWDEIESHFALAAEPVPSISPAGVVFALLVFGVLLFLFRSRDIRVGRGMDR